MSEPGGLRRWCAALLCIAALVGLAVGGAQSARAQALPPGSGTAVEAAGERCAQEPSDGASGPVLDDA